MTEREIFVAALRLPDPAERRALLDRACGGDHAARRRVEELLVEHDRLGSFLERPAAPHATATYSPAAATTGDPATPPFHPSVVGPAGGVVGPYKLLEVIGEGGMGTVWMADQAAPIRRRVAVKVVKPGMDSKQVLARFEAERQALALMDHPNIARVLDAGTTPEGRPYFVMELVKGVPITKYCDDRHLGVADRLRVFQQVCGAVQHAHQKGVIHRDLKPTNVLVESHDGRPVPKVIDFGLAKAVGAAALTDRSLFTHFGAVLGTPLYMAPEQAEFGALDVDTRADVYALGVILYELLTGTTPIEKGRLAAAAWDEVRRVIKEEEPPTPSARLSTSAGRASVAALRQTDPGKLGRFVRGDLDWVVMKALAKERDRRYESAAAFAADVERFLNVEPVAAGPPTAGYRLRRFARRNRPQVVAAGLVLAALVAGVVGTTAGLVIAERARRAEAEQRAAAEAERDEKEAARRQAVANLRRARDAGDRLLTRVAEEHLLHVPHLEPVRRRLLEDALEFHRGFLAEHGDDPDVMLEAALAHVRLGRVCNDLGRKADAEQHFRRAIGMLGPLADGDSPPPDAVRGLHSAWSGLGAVIGDVAGPAESAAAHRTALRYAESLAARFPAGAEYRRMVVGSCLNVYAADPQAPDAAAHCRRAADLAGEDATMPAELGRALIGWATLRQLTNNTPDALAAARRAVAIYEALARDEPANPNHLSGLGWARHLLAQALRASGQPGEAHQALQGAAAAFARVADDYPNTPRYRFAQASVLHGLGKSFLANGDAEKAEEALRSAYAIYQRLANRDAVPPALMLPALTDAHFVLNRVMAAGGRDQELLDLTNGLAALRTTAAGAAYLALAETHKADAGLEMARALAARGRAADADAAIAEVMAAQARLESELPDRADVRANLVILQMRLGERLLADGRLPEARVLYLRANAHCDRLTVELPATARSRVDQAGCQTKLGIIARKEGRPEEAEKWFGRAILTWKGLADAYPAGGEYARGHANEHYRLGLLQAERGRPADAERSFAMAARHFDRAAELLAPGEPSWAGGASRCHRADQLAILGRPAEAAGEYRAALGIYEWWAPKMGQTAVYTANVAVASNGLARVLLAEGGGTAEAVRLARRAVSLRGNDGRFWQTLGVAHYRSGEFVDAVAALKKSIALRAGGDGFDWFYLAMASDRLGRPDDARRWFRWATEWADKHKPNDPGIRRLRAEAAEVFGVRSEARPVAPPPRPVRP